MTKPDGNGASITVRKIGKKAKIFCCIGSGGFGFSFCCIHMLSPIAIGHAPIIKKEGGSQGIKPKRLKTVVGSLSDRSLIQPKKGW